MTQKVHWPAAFIRSVERIALQSDPSRLGQERGIRKKGLARQEQGMLSLVALAHGRGLVRQ